MQDNFVEQTLTVGEIREILKIGTNTAYNLIHSKAFPVKRVGHSYRIPTESFYKWLGGQKNVTDVSQIDSTVPNVVAKI